MTFFTAFADEMEKLSDRAWLRKYRGRLERRPKKWWRLSRYERGRTRGMERQEIKERHPALRRKPKTVREKAHANIKEEEWLMEQPAYRNA